MLRSHRLPWRCLPLKEVFGALRFPPPKTLPTQTVRLFFGGKGETQHTPQLKAMFLFLGPLACLRSYSGWDGDIFGGRKLQIRFLDWSVLPPQTSEKSVKSSLFWICILPKKNPTHVNAPSSTTKKIRPRPHRGPPSGQHSTLPAAHHSANPPVNHNFDRIHMVTWIPYRDRSLST